MMNISELREYCQYNNIPSISQQTQEVLEQIISKHKPQFCLEIGSAVWYSTSFISSLINQRWWYLYSFEISHPAYIQSIKNNQIHSNNTIYPFNFSQTNLDKLIPNQLDFIFIDAQKSQYTEYIIKLEKKITNSIIVLDDVIKYKNNMQSLYEYLYKNQVNYQIIETEPWDWVLIIDNSKRITK